MYIKLFYISQVYKSLDTINQWFFSLKKEPVALVMGKIDILFILGRGISNSCKGEVPNFEPKLAVEKSLQLFTHSIT